MTDTDTSLSPDQQKVFDNLYGPQGDQTPTAAPAKPGVFQGGWKALAGVPSGAAAVGLGAASAATGGSDMLGTQYARDVGFHDGKLPVDPVHQSIEQLRQSAAEFYRPDPQTTGFVGNTLFGAFDVGTQIGLNTLFAGRGGAPLTALGVGAARTKDLEADGVNSDTAILSGGVTTGALLVPGIAPSWASGLLSKIAIGSGANVVTGGVSRALDHQVLQAGGYHEQAEQQKWNDAQSILADAVIGGAFPAAHAGLERITRPGEATLAPAEAPAEKPPAAAVDAALVSKSAAQARDSAPGVPADPRSASAHADALDTAVGQLTEGRPVTTDGYVEGAKFVPRPADPAGNAVEQGLKDGGVTHDEMLSVTPRRSNEDISAEFAGQLTDHEASVAKYATLPDAQGGKVLNTDVARELSDEYLADRTRSAAVHEPASAFIKRVYADKLDAPVPEGEDGSVLFTAGGTGAGKTTSLNVSPEAQDMARRASIIYDTNMNKFSSADQKVQQALDAGRKVRIAYTYRDPVDALVNGALPRAERQRAKFGTGRTVPLAEHLKTHVGALDVMNRLAEKYKDNPDFSIHPVDNSFGKGGALPAALADLAPIDSPGLRPALAEALRQAHNDGRISDATYRGFAEGEESLNEPRNARTDSPAPNQGAQGARPLPDNAQGGEGIQGAGRGDGPGPAEEPQSPHAEPDGLEPGQQEQVDIARQAASEHPDTPLPDGTTAGEAMAAADAEVEQARKTADGIAAAVACFLRFGEDVA